MRPPVDLHIHSVYSDGTATLPEICTLALHRGISTFALSDHDTTDGIEPIREIVNEINRGEQRLSLIPAIELSSGDNGLVHVLGYGIRPGSEPLESELAALKRIRAERNLEAIRMLEKLLGKDLMPDPAPQDEAGSVLGRMHIARLLIEHKIVHSVDEAFRKYLGVGKPAYLPLKHMSTQRAIALLRMCGTVPVLAHPVRIGMLDGDAEQTIAEWKEYGLMGLEVFHPSASNPQVKQLHRLALEHGLLITGGSDFHGMWGIRSKIGGFPAGWQTWKHDLDALQAAMQTADISLSKGDR